VQEKDSLFQILVLSLGNAAMIGLGLTSDPETNQVEVRLDIARENIAMLEMLESKTKNNLLPVEQNILESLLYDLRLKYLEANRSDGHRI
jgi:type II secretory pathway component PulL